MLTNIKNNQEKPKILNFYKEFLKVLLIISFCINLFPVNLAKAQMPLIDWAHIKEANQVRITVENLTIKDDLVLEMAVKIKNPQNFMDAEGFTGKFSQKNDQIYFKNNSFENIINIYVGSELDVKIKIQYGNNPPQTLSATIPPYMTSNKKESPELLPPYYGEAKFEELSGSRLKVNWDEINSLNFYGYKVKLTSTTPASYQIKQTLDSSVIFENISGNTDYNVEIYALDEYLQVLKDWIIQGSYKTKSSGSTVTPPQANPCTIAMSKDFSVKNLSFNLNSTLSGTDLELTKDILKCLGESGQAPSAELKKIQGKRKLLVDGIIGIQTAFDLGYKVGETLNLGNNEPQKCSSLIVNYNKSTKNGNLVFYPDVQIPGFQNGNQSNKKLFKEIVNCLGLSKETDPIKIITELRKKPAFSHLFPTANVTGAAFMYYLGSLFGIEGGKTVIKDNQINVPETPRPEITVTIPENINNCDFAFTNDFDNGYSSIDLSKTLPNKKNEEKLLKNISDDCLKLDGDKLIDKYKSYQRERKLEADGKVGSITGFNLGFDVGIKKGVTATTTCESVLVDFVNLPDKDIVSIANCTKISTKETIEKILDDLKTQKKDLIYLDKNAPVKSLSLLYFIGKKYAENGGKQEITESETTAQSTECTEAFNGNFGNSYNSIKTEDPSSYGPGEANLMQEIYVNCLKISGEDFVEMTKSFQTEKKLSVDAQIGPVTGFNLGVDVGKKFGGEAKPKCQEIKIDYTTLSDTDLIKIINCLGISKQTSLPKIYEELDKDPNFSSLLYNKGKGVALTYYLGKLFGQAIGGEGTETESLDNPPSLTPEEEQKLINDPCARYNTYEKEGNIVPNMEFGGKKVLLIPDSPGTLDWKKLTLDNFLGGSRNDNDTINRKDCLVGPGVFMGLVWKIVILFESLLGIICVAMLVYGGFLYLTAAGDDGRSESGTKTITWAIIGAVLVITSRLIVQIFIPRSDNDRVFYDQDKLLTKEAVTPGIEGIIGITNFILGFVGAISILMIIYGGYLYAISHGDEGLQGKGKNILFEAIIGVILVVIAYTIVSTAFSAGGLAIK